MSLENKVVRKGRSSKKTSNKNNVLKDLDVANNGGIINQIESEMMKEDKKSEVNDLNKKNEKNKQNELVEEFIEDKVKVKKDEFIEKANAIHKNKYDYSEVKYKNMQTRVEVICKEKTDPSSDEIHGVFEVRPSHHVNSASGCPTCARIRANNSNKSTKEEFVEKARKHFGDKFDYDESVYLGNDVDVTIRCKKDGHGTFTQTPHNHIVSTFGCPKCCDELKENNIIRRK